MILLALFVAIHLGHAAVMAWSFLAIRRFLAETPAIADHECLARYKRLVRIQMYLALFVVVWLAVSIVVGVMLMLKYGLGGFVIMMAGSGWLMGVGLLHKRSEVRARNLEAASAELEHEYRKVSHAWVKDALPSF